MSVLPQLHLPHLAIPHLGLPDLHSLDTTATRLDQRATELRARVYRLRAATDALLWQSVAAATFRRRGELTCIRLTQAAEGLNHTADVLRRHAATARGRVAGIGSVEQIATGALHLVGL